MQRLLGDPSSDAVEPAGLPPRRVRGFVGNDLDAFVPYPTQREPRPGLERRQPTSDD